jgi:hemoglobin
MSTSLFERLGAVKGIKAIASDLVDNHMTNPTIATRFAKSDLGALKKLAADFMIAGTGGENNYKGMDMLTAHKGMNISALEFMAVLDDALAAMDKHSVGQREQEEVLFILYSMRSQIVLV